MKKIFSLIMVFALFLSLVGCKEYSKNQVPIIDTSDTEMLKEKYITPIVKSNGGSLGSWENANNANPYWLLNFINIVVIYMTIIRKVNIAHIITTKKK